MELHSGRHPFGNSRHGRSAATVTPAPAFVVSDPRARQTPLMPVPHLSFPRKRESRTAALWTPAFAGVTRRGCKGNGEACRTESIAAGTAQRLRSFQTETLPMFRRAGPLSTPFPIRAVRAASGRRPLGRVMKCHGPPCPRLISDRPSGHDVVVCTGLPGMPPVYPPLCLRHGSLLSIPFRSHRRLPACGGSLFRAYRMRAPAPAFAPARLCAPDCAREPSAGRTSPVRSVGVFFAPARGRRRSGLRMPLPPVSFYHGFTGVKPNLGIISIYP